MSRVEGHHWSIQIFVLKPGNEDTHRDSRVLDCLLNSDIPGGPSHVPRYRKQTSRYRSLGRTGKEYTCATCVLRLRNVRRGTAARKERRTSSSEYHFSRVTYQETGNPTSVSVRPVAPGHRAPRHPGVTSRDEDVILPVPTSETRR